MRLALLASALTAVVMWFAMGDTPARSQQSPDTPAACPKCAMAKSCPQCGHGHGWRAAHDWEYKCVHQSERASNKAAEAMTTQFNGLGEQGWRLAKADNGFWCFTRIRGSQ